MRARYAEEMAKHTAPTSKTPLTTLVERASPGSVTFVKPTYSVRAAYEITVLTRDCPITFVGGTIDEVATDALSFCRRALRSAGF